MALTKSLDDAVKADLLVDIGLFIGFHDWICNRVIRLVCKSKLNRWEYGLSVFTDIFWSGGERHGGGFVERWKCPVDVEIVNHLDGHEVTTPSLSITQHLKP